MASVWKVAGCKVYQVFCIVDETEFVVYPGVIAMQVTGTKLKTRDRLKSCDLINQRVLAEYEQIPPLFPITEK